ALEFCVAVAAYGPVEVTARSSAIFPNVIARGVKPGPAAVTAPVDAPEPYRRSLGNVVVTAPLVMAEPVPVRDALTSTGLTLSIPEYSLMYTVPNEVIGVEYVTVTVFAPPAMFLAYIVLAAKVLPQFARVAPAVYVLPFVSETLTVP